MNNVVSDELILTKLNSYFYDFLFIFYKFRKFSEWTSIKRWLTVRNSFPHRSFNHGAGHAALHDVVWWPVVRRRRQRWGRARQNSGAHCREEASAWPGACAQGKVSLVTTGSSISPDRRPRRRRARQGQRSSGCLRNLAALGLGREARRRRQRQLGTARRRSWRKCPARKGGSSRWLAGNALDGGSGLWCGFGGATPVTRWGSDRRPEWNRQRLVLDLGGRRGSRRAQRMADAGRLGGKRRCATLGLLPAWRRPWRDGWARGGFGGGGAGAASRDSDGVAAEAMKWRGETLQGLNGVTGTRC
jgi:hypothetical protein